MIFVVDKIATFYLERACHDQFLTTPFGNSNCDVVTITSEDNHDAHCRTPTATVMI